MHGVKRSRGLCVRRELERSPTVHSVGGLLIFTEKRWRRSSRHTRSLERCLSLAASEAPERMIMQPHDLLRYYSVLVEFRNLCAHDERLYCAKVGKSRDIDYSQMGTCLLNVIQQEQFEFFLEEIMECFRTYGRDLKVVDMDSLLSDMGFKLEK